MESDTYEAKMTTMKKNTTIPQLIKFLKTSFRKCEFEQVQNILLYRESQLNKQIDDLNNQNDVLSRKVASLEQKLSKQQQERSGMEAEIELWKTRYWELACKIEALEVEAEAEKMPDKGKPEPEREPNGSDCVKLSSSVGDLSGSKRTLQDCEKGQQSKLLNATKEDVFKRKRESYTSSSSDDDTSSSSDTEYGSKKNSSMNKPWDSEIEMFLAVQKSDELSMKAVCALYRQHTLSKKSVGGAFSFQNRGFKEAYAYRGRILGKFLTDGDLEGKLTKSLWDLRNYDPSALDECKKIAIEHYKELFEIYKKNEYVFFP